MPAGAEVRDSSAWGQTHFGADASSQGPLARPECRRESCNALLTASHDAEGGSDHGVDVAPNLGPEPALHSVEAFVERSSASDSAKASARARKTADHEAYGTPAARRVF